MEPTNEQLADWIEKGLATPKVREDKDSYLLGDRKLCTACALGLCVIGKLGITAGVQARTEQEDAGVSDSTEQMANILGISERRAARIERPHLDGLPAAEIAQMLRRNEI